MGRSRWLCCLRLDCWDRGFEYRGRAGCSSLVFVVCCVSSGLCDRLVTRTEEPYRVHACVCVWSRNPQNETPRSDLGYSTTEKQRSVDYCLSLCSFIPTRHRYERNCSANFWGGNNTSASQCMVYCTAMSISNVHLSVDISGKIEAWWMKECIVLTFWRRIFF